MDTEGPTFTTLTPQMMDLKDALIQDFSDYYPKEESEDTQTLFLRLAEFFLKPEFYRECLDNIEFSKPVRPLWKDLPVFYPEEVVNFREALIQTVLKFLPLRQSFDDRRRYLQYSYELLSGICVADAIGDMRDLITEWRVRNSCFQVIENTPVVELLHKLHGKLLEYYPTMAPEANKANYMTFAKDYLSNRFFHRYVFPSSIPIRGQFAAIALNPAMENLQKDLEGAVLDGYPVSENIFVRAHYLVRARRNLTADFFEAILDTMPHENKRNFKEIEDWRYKDYPTFQMIREVIFRILPRSIFR